MEIPHGFLYNDAIRVKSLLPRQACLSAGKAHDPVRDAATRAAPDDSRETLYTHHHKQRNGEQT